MDTVSSRQIAFIGTFVLAIWSTGIAQDRSQRDSTTGAESKTAHSQVYLVEAEKTLVFAGPSDEFYPTSVLRRGDSVEVFHRTDSGWMAIRPPEGSFSWLPATQGYLLPGGRVLEVTDSAAVSWIGSALGTAKQYRWQVELQRGEQLSVLGEEKIRDENRETLWYKITPPNGEYRWIRADDLARDPQRTSATSRDSEASGNQVQTASSELRNSATANVRTAEHQSANAKPASTNQPTKNRTSMAPSASSSSRASSPSKSSQSSMHAANNHAHRQDPFEDWHAMEYGAGGLSFPGVARMFGYGKPEQQPTRAPNYPGPVRRHNGSLSSILSNSDNSKTAPRGAIDITHMDDDNLDAVAARSLRERQSWRDPRQIRDERSKNRIGSLASNAQSPVRDLVIQPEWQEEIGTGVLPASATAEVALPGASGNVSTAPWYGIHQAPTNTASEVLELSSANLSEIQLMLSEMVVGPERTWNLAPLADRTRYYIENGASAVERGEARLLLERIEAFADLARRSMQLAPLGSTGYPDGQIIPASGVSMSGLPGAAGPASLQAGVPQSLSRFTAPLGIQWDSAIAKTPTSSAPQFDGTGWLVPVHSNGRELPTHALTNDDGKAIVYLTPAAGVNLSRYQGQAVGVYGLRGYLPQLKSNHIQVQRVVRLQ